MACGGACAGLCVREFYARTDARVAASTYDRAVDHRRYGFNLETIDSGGYYLPPKLIFSWLMIFHAASGKYRGSDDRHDSPLDRFTAPIGD